LTPRLMAEPSVRRYCPHAPTRQQTVALVAHHFLPDEEKSEVFYGGAAGGGKSDWLLMGALEYVDVPGYAALILRRSYTDLSLPGAIMARSKEWLTRTDAIWNEQRKQWSFPSGASLQFAYMDHDGDELRFQSAEFQYIGFDELTQFPEAQYTYLFSRLRRPELNDETPAELRMAIAALQHVPLRQRAASNPGGIGHGWVKKRFPIDGVPRGRRVFVPAKIADNPHLDARAYRASLSELGETLQRQLEDGDWQVAEGLAFHVSEIHRVERFVLPDAFSRFEACDYGLNGAPWALWAVDYEGNLIAVEMLYEQDRLPSDIADLVIARRKAGWGLRNRAVADPSIWHRTGARDKWGRERMLADEFSEHGVPVAPANNDPRAGLIRLRELLTPDPDHSFPSWHPRAGEKGAPRIFFVRGECDAIVDELEAAPLQPTDKRDGGEIVDPMWESRHGHAVAMTRYAVMTRPSASEPPPPANPHLEPPIPPEELRREALAERIRQAERPARRRKYTLT
jgi:hypothetical protein